MTTKLAWLEGDPVSAGVGGWVWITDEENNMAVVEIDTEGVYSRPKGVGKVTAWAGPIEPPDETTLP